MIAPVKFSDLGRNSRPGIVAMTGINSGATMASTVRPARSYAAGWLSKAAARSSISVRTKRAVPHPAYDVVAERLLQKDGRAPDPLTGAGMSHELLVAGEGDVVELAVRNRISPLSPRPEPHVQLFVEAVGRRRLGMAGDYGRR